jgi:hypothetical protein
MRFPQRRLIFLDACSLFSLPMAKECRVFLFVDHRCEVDMVQTISPSTEQPFISNENRSAGAEETKAVIAIPTVQDSGGIPCCGHCGAHIEIHRPSRFSAGEISLNIVCGVVLVAVFVSGAYFINSLSEYATNHLFHHWAWHEPLDNWNM